MMVLILGLGPLLLESSLLSRQSESPHEVFTESYVAHAPISISSDAGFAGYPGSGTFADPYRIENLLISTSSQIAISISSTTVYFVIRNCYITNSTTAGPPNGISITNAKHARIEDTLIEFKHIAVYLENTNDTTVSNTTMSESNYGIYMNSLYDSYLNANYFYNIGYPFITDTVVNATLSDSYFEDSSYSISLYYTNDTIVSNNQVVDFNTGLYVTGVSNITVSNNTIDDGTYGISGNGIWYSSFTNNSVFNTYLAYDIAGHDVDLIRNTVVNCSSGIQINGYYNFMLQGTSVLNSQTVGLYLSGVDNISLYDSYLTGGGVFLSGTQDSHYLITENNNTVNGKPLLYLHSTQNMIIDGSTIGQLIVVNSTNIRLNGGHFTGGTTQFHKCDISEIYDAVYDVGYFAISIMYSSNVTLSNLDITSKMYAATIGAANNVTVVDCTVRDFSNTGVFVSAGMNGLFRNLTFDSTGDTGLYLNNFSYAEVESNYFHNVDYSMSIKSNSHNVTTRGNYIENSRYGIYMSWDENITHVDNIIKNATNTGIYLDHCSWSLLSNNTVVRSDRGIYSYYSDNVTIYDNIIMSCSGNGIHIGTSSLNFTIFNNKIGWNGVNAVDDGSSNSWDDGVSIGNYWSNYTGIGVYSVSGTAGSIDHYPQGLTAPIPPVIEPTDNRTIIEGVTDQYVEWRASDYLPDSYVIYRNGTVIDNSDWDGNNVTLSLDGFSAGVYNVTVVVYDRCGYSNKSWLYVVVIDNTAPSLNDTTDLEFEYGQLVHVEWIGHDLHPDKYFVYRNGTKVTNGTWVSGTSIVVESDLDLGVFNFTILLLDESGNSGKDTVWVAVRDTTAPVISTPPDILYVQGVNGHNINWVLSDYFGDHYEIYRNGTLIISTRWQDNVSLNVDSLAVGVYNYTIVAYDQSGNSHSDTVFVIVDPATTNPTTTTSTTTTNTTEGPSIDFSSVPMWLFGVVVSSMTVVIVILVVLLTRRRP